jgi:hypothetical protein
MVRMPRGSCPLSQNKFLLNLIKLFLKRFNCIKAIISQNFKKLSQLNNIKQIVIEVVKTISSVFNHIFSISYLRSRAIERYGFANRVKSTALLIFAKTHGELSFPSILSFSQAFKLKPRLQQNKLLDNKFYKNELLTKAAQQPLLQGLQSHPLWVC